MPSSPLPRLHALLWSASLLLLVAACDCGGGGLPTRTCTTTADCGGSNICIDGTCQEPGVDGGTLPDGAANTCEDPDGDGFGPGCAAGDDCDPSDPTQTGREVCDGRDNDCDGVVDNGVLSACGDCNPDCSATTRGPGGDTPFDPEMDDSDGVGLDDDGAIVLDSRMVDTQFIWIANTGEGSVSKVDTETYEEVARYITGPDGGGNDPSRTSVNSVGDVYVGNRGGTSISRISTLQDTCPDTNGDGTVTTSTGPSTLPWGQDDCVLWNTDLPGGGIIRAVAAQDVVGPDGELREYVWAGGWNGVVWKLDGQTGEILLQTPSPVPTYGFALDAAGNLWISGWSSSALGRLDTSRCVDTASCDVSVCGDDGDDCVKQRINAPDRCYGITVDFAQRVWCGGDTVKRYDPALALGGRWTTENVGYFCNGIAADAMGSIWVACQGADAMVRMVADDPTMRTAIVNGSISPRGVAIDADGKVWGINREHDDAVVITPGAGLMDNTVEYDIATGLVSPYTYSDMTGLQLRLATNPRGYYRAIVEGCAEDAANPTEWGELRYEVETPAGTSVTFRVRTADTREALDAAEWVTVANIPDDASPADIATALMDAGVEVGRWLMVEAQLQSDRSSPREVITPRVLAIDVTYVCPPDFG
ncbi:MAG TPA: hypothetical protein RMH85_18935 [Polyangiaceae bacterium LLY-WYZ-15_(1-7)]|nr:hypothetical protein [Myxococcales bacterium]MAT29473.1 hypothetical protein [Sandaracinus sp.]HJL05085.1 hypothetical protein [Polyangiaceae bacterium LLY-WYZ-15_(1-7)]MBJ70649.1 hypothetical protein [Sandaracinus sp.]HJL10584.1 hypothetical protein [Polyangiaceae bacterium LLY-WYZ-15_(1-7)]